MRWTAWRGGPSLGNYKGANEAEADAAALADASGLAERYAAERSGALPLTTLGGLLIAFHQSAAFKKLSESTKVEWGRLLKEMKDDKIGKMATVALKATRATAVFTTWRDKVAEARGARAADYRMEVLSRALSWNVQQGNAPKNPVLGIESIWRNDRSDLIWEAKHIETYRNYVAAEIDRVWTTTRPDDPHRHRSIASLAAARDALTVALNTGMRREDISVLSKKEIDDGVIGYTARKGARRARTKGKQARITIVPILSELARMLAYRDEALGTTSPWIITSSKGGNYTPGALGQLVNETAKLAGVDRHLHDAKGTFVTRVKVETDLTDEEIADMVDWSKESVRNIVRTYVSTAAVGNAMRERFKRKKAT